MIILKFHFNLYRLHRPKISEVFLFIHTNSEKKKGLAEMNHFSLATILSTFHYPEKLLQKTGETPMMYFGVNIYCPDTDLFRHCLYIVEGNIIPDPLLNGLYGCIVIPSDNFSGQLAAETVIWPERISAALLLNQIQNLYLSQSSQGHMAHILMSSLSLNTSIGSVVHQAATIMQNAIILLDPAYQLIAMEGLGCEINDIFWKDCLEIGRVSDENVLLIKNSGLTKDLEQTNSTALWGKRELFNHIPRLARKIYSVDHAYLGTIAVIQCKHAFTTDDYFLLDALVETLSAVLADYDYLTTTQKTDSELLLYLLKSAETPVFTDSAAKRLTEIQNCHFYLAGFIPLRDDPAVSRLGAYLQAVLLSERAGILSALQGRNVIVLMCFEDFKEIAETERWLQEKLSSLQITIGLSSVFTDVKQFAQHLSLAEEAIHLGLASDGAKRAPVYAYPRVSYLELLHALPISSLEQYVQKSPIAILDTKKYLEFYKTLSCFVNHLGSYSETAQSLFIHKNTLLYRLSKIQSLTGIDYTSPADILSAALSLTIKEYLTHPSDISP